MSSTFCLTVCFYDFGSPLRDLLFSEAVLRSRKGVNIEAGRRHTGRRMELTAPANMKS